MVIQRFDNVIATLSSISKASWNDQSEVGLELEWDRYLIGLSNHRCGVRLSDADEEYERSRWLRGQFSHRNHNNFVRLVESCDQFFWELTRAGRQQILGSRANLPLLEGAARPHPDVAFGPIAPLQTPPLATDAYEMQVGGPHVLGARLLWWCAAAAAPSKFGYAFGFSRQLLLQPFWCIETPRVQPSPRPLTLLAEAAKFVSCCPLDSKSAERCESQLQQDGPRNGGMFYRRGIKVEVTPTPLRMLTCLWSNLPDPVCIEELAEATWGHDNDVEDGNISGTICKLNRVIEPHGMRVSRQRGTGWVTLEVDD